MEAGLDKATREKDNQDRKAVADLAAKGTRPVRLVYADGGQHPSFSTTTMDVSRPDELSRGVTEIMLDDPAASALLKAARARSSVPSAVAQRPLSGSIGQTAMASTMNVASELPGVSGAGGVMASDRRSVPQTVAAPARGIMPVRTAINTAAPVRAPAQSSTADLPTGSVPAPQVQAQPAAVRSGPTAWFERLTTPPADDNGKPRPIADRNADQ
jgi:hypothetical protein